MTTAPTTRKQLFRRYDVAQLFGVHVNTVKNYQARGWLTPVRARTPGRRRRIRCIRHGRPATVLTRGPLVLYHIAELKKLARRLLRDVPEIGALYGTLAPLVLSANEIKATRRNP